MSLQFHFYLHSVYILVIATQIAACCCYGNTVVMFKGWCYCFLFSTTKSLFDFWLYQAYHAVSLIFFFGPVVCIQCLFLHSGPLPLPLIYIYIYIWIYIDMDWGLLYLVWWFSIIIFQISIFIIAFPIFLASLNISSSWNLIYGDKEHCE